MSSDHDATRRAFLKSTGAIFGAAALETAGIKAVRGQTTAALDGGAPALEQGIQIGDVDATRAVIWSRADRPSRMLVEHATSADFANSVAVRGPHALEASDFAARLDLTSLPPNSEIFVRVSFEDLSNARIKSEPVLGRFRTAPLRARDLRFVWSGDTAGQGWGINPDFGGMRIYETMRRTNPDFFIHSGDNIYADGPIAPVQTAEGGRLWRNHRHARGREGRRDARRISRPLQVQPPRRERPAVQRRSSADLAVGRPRGREQLVGLERPIGRRALRGEERASPDRPRHARVSRVRADALVRHRRKRASLSARGVRLVARCVRRRHAQLPRTEYVQSASRARCRNGILRHGATLLAQAKPASLGRGMESDCRRHAARARRRRRHGRERPSALRESRERRRTRAWPRIRAGRPAALHQARTHRQRRLAHGRRPLLRGALLQSSARGVQGFLAVLGVRRWAAQRRAASDRMCSTTPSAPKWSSRKRRRRQTTRRSRACNSSARSTSPAQP